MPESKPKGVYSIRLDAAMQKRIDAVGDRYHSLHARLGFSAGEPPIPSRAAVIRMALNEGLAAMEQKLSQAESKRSKGGRS